MNVMEEWKKSKFVVTDLFQFDGIMYVVVLSDFNFWANEIDELEDWCSQHNAKVKGMTVEIYNEETLTLFYLKWS